jgi:hypothetical protein
MVTHKYKQQDSNKLINQHLLNTQMNFIIATFLGLVSAKQLSCGCAQPVAICDSGCGYSTGYAGLSNNLNALLPGQDRAGGYAKLTSESAGSQTQIGAQNIVIPDKHTVTDQAKVSEACSKGSNQEQNCQVAKRDFDINGHISVTEKYNDSSKGEHVASKEGSGAS